MGNPYFKVFQGSDEQWYFTLYAGNGEAVANGEGYTEKQAAIGGCEAVARASAAAQIEVEEPKEAKPEKKSGGDCCGARDKEG